MSRFTRISSFLLAVAVLAVPALRAQTASDSVRDLGTGNQVTTADFAGDGGRDYGRAMASPLAAQSHRRAVSDTTEILDAAEAFLSAFNRLEWEPFHASFQPDATVFQPFDEPFRNDGREEVAAFFQSFFDQVRAARDGPPYLEIEPEDLRIDPIGEAAVVTFHLPGEEQVGRRTLVFGRDASDAPWRIAHLHASTLEQRRVFSVAPIVPAALLLLLLVDGVVSDPVRP